MELVRLKGKTLKGKNRVQEKGEIWKVIQKSEGTQWVKRGELLVQPVDNDWQYARWVDPDGDEHFTVEFI